MKIVRSFHYEPTGDIEIDAQTAYVQAANALDDTMRLAQERGDSEAMVQVAAMWMELASRLGSSDDEEEIEEIEDSTSHGFGFNPRIETDTGIEEEIIDQVRPNRIGF